LPLFYSSVAIIAMKAKREFSTSGDRAVKPFCPADFSLSRAQKWGALDN
jgi:hypothetical protein